MRKGGGREKGFQYERVIAKQLGQWWCNDPKALWRNTNSGARSTVVGQVYGGDIIPVNESAGRWPLCVEVKKSESWSFDSFIYGNPGNELLSFMLQCLHASEVGCNKIPLLICTKNRKKPLCLLHRNQLTVQLMRKKHPKHVMNFRWTYAIPKTLNVRYPTKNKPNFYVMPLEEFLQCFSKGDFL